MEEGRAFPISKYFNIAVNLLCLVLGSALAKSPCMGQGAWVVVPTLPAFLAEKHPASGLVLSAPRATNGCCTEWRPRRDSRYNHHLTTLKAKAEVNGDNFREPDKRDRGGVSDFNKMSSTKFTLKNRATELQN